MKDTIKRRNKRECRIVVDIIMYKMNSSKKTYTGHLVFSVFKKNTKQNKVKINDIARKTLQPIVVTRKFLLLNDFLS